MLRAILCLAVGASSYAPSTGLKLPRAHDIAAGCIATGLACAAPALAAGDDLSVKVNSLNLPTKELTIDVGGVPPLFSGGRVTAQLSFDTKKQKDAADISIALPKDLKAAADGAAKGDVALTLQTVPIKVALPAPIGTQKIPGVGPARLDVDVNLLPGKAIAEIRSPAIPGIKLPGKKVSDWNMVVNMGSGEAYYFNKKTGTTTYEAPF